MVRKSVRSLYFAMTWVFLFGGRMFGILSQTQMFEELGTQSSFIIVACIQIILIGVQYLTSYTKIHASDVATYLEKLEKK